MTDLLIRNIDPHLKRQLQESARSHRRSLSEEARMLLKKALLEPPDKRKMGTALLELFPTRGRIGLISLKKFDWTKVRPFDIVDIKY